MRTTNMSEDDFLLTLQAELNIRHTDEQKDFIKNINNTMICFASPGTGKTTTAVTALLFAELYRGISGENIYALSFTRMATAEIKVRHRKTLTQLSVPAQTINFKTLHSLCAKILADNFHLLNMNKLSTEGSMPMAKAVSLIDSLMREKGKPITQQCARAVVHACRKLNSCMVFDRDYVTTKQEFKNTKLDFDTFTEIRRDLFRFALLTEVIPVDMIMLYALTLMQKFPQVSKDFKEKCKLMVVDEAQDLSLLHLRLISMMTDNPVLIGDMKQQIYAFNGACQEIVQKFYSLFPNAITKSLTQSFRCKDEIIEYANKIIEYNEIDTGGIKGVGEGGNVQFVNGISLQELAQQFHDEYFGNNEAFVKDTMFLFRNNASAVPIVDALFQQKVPFLVNNYLSATELPIIKEMIELLNLCRNPYNFNYVSALAYLIPELRTFHNPKESPFYKLLTKSSCSIFEVNYVFKDIAIGSQVMTVLSDISESIKTGVSVNTLLNMLWPIYYENYVKQREWMNDYAPSYYIRLVQDLVRDKTFDKFVSDEAAKLNFYKENEQYKRGIRCYTMHAAKSLEADVVYILDAEEGIIPNLKKLDDLCKSHCEMDAAREIRNERALCYVAITRAKENVYIMHTNEPSSMLQGKNEFKSFDDTYKVYSSMSDDISAFNDFVGELII